MACNICSFNLAELCATTIALMKDAKHDIATTMPAKEKHAKSFVLLSQNVALNKTSGGKFYRSAMQGGMCDVMAYKLSLIHI